VNRCLLSECLEAPEVNPFDVYQCVFKLAAAAARNLTTLATIVSGRSLGRCEDKAWLHFHDDLYG